jgi:pyruvate dehydrogenase E1 component beta subunit
MIAAIRDENPVVYIDDRWLYRQEGMVPEEIYEVPIGKSFIRKKGADITLVSSSFMATESFKAAQELEKEGIDVELIDLRTVKPLDESLILKSLRKTGRMVITDGGWKNCGVSTDVSAMVSEKGFKYLKAPVKRITLPDSPAPASCVLEKKYYPDANSIIKVIKTSMMKKS